MPTYVIKDASNNVLRVETASSTPPLKSGESASTTVLAFPGWPIGTGKQLRFISNAYTVVDTRDITTAKTQKSAEINSARTTSNLNTFQFGGKTISCSAIDRSDMDAVNGIVCLTGAFPTGFSNTWKAVDNTYISIPDKATWISFYSAMANKIVDNFNYSQTLKTTLDAATTTTQVDSIQWSRS